MRGLSERCMIRLGTCHVDLQSIVIKVGTYQPVMVTWGFRGKGEQNKAVADGYSSLRWPNSKHNHMNGDNPESLAVDIVPYKYGQVINWSDVARWRLMASYMWQVGLKNDIKLKWGGYFGDYSHFELIGYE